MNVIISRTDSIGDAVLSLPVAKALRDFYPGVKIGFLGNHYVKDLIDACEHIDEYIDIEQFLNEDVTVCGQKPDAIIHLLPQKAVAKRAAQLKIPIRIGTSHRLYHWIFCNRLVKLGRKNSDLHEAQLNLKLLAVLGIKQAFGISDIKNMYGLKNLQPLLPQFSSLISNDKYNIILHPKSRGNAIEWGIDNFISLIKLLNPDDYNIFISGVEKDRAFLDPLFKEAGDKVIDITGKMSLAQFISFTKQCDGLIACSTGPVHFAAALGIHAYGLYSAHRPIFAKRWGPIGEHVFIWESQNKKHALDMNDILPEKVKQVIDLNNKWKNSLMIKQPNNLFY